MNFEKYPFDTEFQDMLLACIIKHPDKFLYNANTLNSAYFSGAPRVATSRALFKYWRENSCFPKREVLRQVVYDAIARSSESKDEDTISTYVSRLLDMETTDVKYVVSKTVEFARERAVYIAIEKSFNIYKDGKTPEGGFTKLFEDALKVGMNLDELGYIVDRTGDDIETVVNKITAKGYGTMTGYPDFDRIWPTGWGPGWLIAILAPPKRLKCLGRGTYVMLYDGSTKRVEDIQLGDQLRGDDSTPRTVGACGKGFGPLYRVTQAGGMSYVCNDVHILCVRDEIGTIMEITAEEYAKTSEGFKCCWCGYRQQGDSVTRCATDVVCIGDGDYYGFEIDGNRRFLLEDFTVTHNTTLCVNIAMNIIERQDSPVFYYPCEISQELATARCLSNLSELSLDSMHHDKLGFISKAKSEAARWLNSALLVKGFASGAATISGDIRAHALTAQSQLKLKPKAIIIDFAETVKPSSDAKHTSEHRAQGQIYLEARALAAEMGCPVILPDRCNKETANRTVPDMTGFQGSFEKAGIVDVGIGLCSTKQEQKDNQIRYFVFLNRHGIAGKHFGGRYIPDKMQMTIDRELEWNAEEDDGKEAPYKAKGGKRAKPAPRDVVDE
jgi:replicative DNA helicase